MQSIEANEAIVKLNSYFTKKEVASNVLRILVDKSGGGGEPASFYLKGNTIVSYFSCDIDEKIRLEISCWRHVLEQALNKEIADVTILKRLSPVLYDIYRNQSWQEKSYVFARTRRMLLLLEALLLGDKSAENNPYVNEIKEIKNVPEKSPNKLKVLSDFIKSETCLKNENGLEGWEVSLPCLLIAAIAESQCEYRQPFAWESYSAARARDELLRKWENLNLKVMNTCALFIHYQSAVGQLGRGSGSGVFKVRIKEEVDKHNLAFGYETLVKALQLLAVIEEARNTTIPNRQNANDNANDIYNSRGYKSWNLDQFKKNIELYLKLPKPKREVTYAYFRPLYADVSNKKFKCLEKYLKLSIDKYETPDQVSLGRHQTQIPVQNLLKNVIEKLTKNNFEEYFKVEAPVKVPCSFSQNRSYEKVSKILLQPHLVAEKLLFPNRDPLNNKGGIGIPKDDTSNSLFRYLVDVSKDEMQLTEDGLWVELDFTSIHFKHLDEKSLYVPYPLVKRITDIVYRLKPESCLSIPVTLDHDAPVWIRLPAGVSEEDEKSKRILANFILATLLNRAMTSGLSHGEVDLQNLAIMDPVSAGNKPGSGLMNPEKWRELVVMLYQQGGYDTLLGPYLRAYNTPSSTVSFGARLSSDVSINLFDGEINAIPIGTVIDDIKKYLPGLYSDSSSYSSENKELWLLGVDIGETLTKCQFFRIESCNGDLRSQGNVFRMTTKYSEKADRNQDTNKLYETIKKRTQLFIDRLIKTINDSASDIVNQINNSYFVIGFSWPGPVRDNYVSGTSGLVGNFGLLRDIKSNKIDDLWLINLADIMKQTWQLKYQNPHEPYVVLLNDGDAEAVGSLIQAMIKTKQSLGNLTDFQRLAVVKLGTGLAGGFVALKNGKLSLISGLYEWGKIILDCAAHPREGFPLGVAAEYLSKRCLPRLAKQRGSQDKFFQQNEPDSLELGRIIELDEEQDATKTKCYVELRIDCGTIQAEKNPPYGTEVSAEVLRVVYNFLTGPVAHEIDPDLRYGVQLALRKSDIEATLIHELEEFGRIRINRLIGYIPPNRGITGAPDECNDLVNSSQFKNSSKLAKECAKILGRYLGDFCVLLHDQLGVEHLILTGGVLNNLGTGKIAKDEASNRVQKYGLNLTPISEDIYKISAENFETETESRPNNKQRESGPYGAACFAAASFLPAKQQEGLQEIRQLLLSQPTGTELSCNEKALSISIKSGTSSLPPVPFAHFALAQEDIRRFLEHRGPNWGYFQSSEDKFIRWEPGE